MSLKDKYQNEIRAKLKDELKLGNIMAVPRLVKIVINVGVKEALLDKKVLDEVARELEAISGQKPVIKKAKKSIATFKLRAGQPIGVTVTLRGRRMYDFLEKLISIVFPRVRDFRGVSREAFDGKGNYSIGFTEQIVFSEIDYDKIDKIRGLEVTIVTNANNDAAGEALLKAFGMPFRKS